MDQIDCFEDRKVSLKNTKLKKNNDNINVFAGV